MTSETGKYLFKSAKMCGRGVRSILSLPPVTRCLETIDVRIWHMFVFMSVVVLCVNVCCVAIIVKDSVF